MGTSAMSKAGSDPTIVTERNSPAAATLKIGEGGDVTGEKTGVPVAAEWNIWTREVMSRGIDGQSLGRNG